MHCALSVSDRVLKHRSVNKNLVKVRTKNTLRKIISNSLLACRLGPYVPASECSRTCGNGTQVFNQTCFNIADPSISVPQVCSNTALCGATSAQNRTCNPDVCISKCLKKKDYRKREINCLVIVCSWSAWVNGRCSVTCGTGAYIRTRSCIDQFARPCSTCPPNPDTNGTRPCFLPSCTGKAPCSDVSEIHDLLQVDVVVVLLIGFHHGSKNN